MLRFSTTKQGVKSHTSLTEKTGLFITNVVILYTKKVPTSSAQSM